MITDLATHPAQFVSPVDLAHYLCVSRSTMYYWLAKGAIQYVKIGGSIRIPIAEARACLQPGTVTASNLSNRPGTQSAPSC